MMTNVAGRAVSGRAPRVVALWAAFLSIGFMAGAQDARVLPYQGQLTDQAGRPISPDNALVMVFRLYDSPTGGTAKWGEVHRAVTVEAGRFSVLLGAIEPFGFDVMAMFDRVVYLGVTIDDGEPTTADVEMRPRQAIVPAFIANRVVADGLPVGAITMFFGTQEDIPRNWQVCDGDEVNGIMLPDLRGRIGRGVAAGEVAGSEEAVSISTAGVNLSAGRSELSFVAVYYICKVSM